MPAVPDWSLPMTLTSPAGTLLLNQEVPSLGAFFLDGDGCKFNIGVRSTKDHVPQSDGDILHHRFLTGTEMPLKIQLWESAERNKVACDALLETMLDTLTRHMRALLNAGDNEGRLAWNIPSGGNIRILDDIRLLVYPDYTQDPSAMGSTVLATVDSQFPYAQDLTQQSTDIADGATETLDNTGSADYFPVFQVQGPTSGFSLSNLTTGVVFDYDSTLPGAVAIGGGDYAEIDTFRNTIFLNGSGANLKAGVSQLTSDYWALVVGENDVTIDGGDVTVLWAPAWG